MSNRRMLLTKVAGSTVPAGASGSTLNVGGVLKVDTGGTGIATVTKAANGTGYTALDLLTVVQAIGADGVNPGVGGIVRVDSVTGGAVNAFTRLATGYNYKVEDGLDVTGGTGSGAKFNITVVGTIGTGAATTEDVLFQWAIPANTLSANNKILRVMLAWNQAANTNTKTMRVYLGTTQIGFRSVMTASTITGIMILNIIRTAAAGELTFEGDVVAAASGAAYIYTPSENTATALNLKVTGQNGSAAAADLTFRALILEVLN